MWAIVAVVIAALFLFLSGLHFYWAIFGLSRPELVLPVITGEKPKLPGVLMTLAVALGLLSFATVFINQVFTFWDVPWLGYAKLAIGVLFIVRAIGDFTYVGFFKSKKGTPFAKMDTKYYAPFCLILGNLILLGEFFS